jgi:hypothetical protein
MSARIVAVPIAFLFLGATTPARVVPIGGEDNEALIIPSDSPVKFQGFDKSGTAHFAGRFTLAGTFSYSCVDCEPGAQFSPPLKSSDLRLEVMPDAALSSRLPHWKNHKQAIVVDIRAAGQLTRTIGSHQQRAALLTGKIDDLHGRVVIVVDQLRTSIECDSAGWWANFVAVTRPPRLSASRPTGDHGCP